MKIMRKLQVLLLMTAGCGAQSSPVDSVRATGQFSPLKERVRPGLDIIEACGDGGITSEELMRAPYVQSVDEQSAHVLWTSNSGADDLQVMLPIESAATMSAVKDDVKHLQTGFQMRAELLGLEPSTIYCYRVMIDGAPATEWTGFKTAGAEDVAFVAVGDSGKLGPAQDAIVQQLDTVPFDLSLILGDLAYPSGAIESLELAYFRAFESFNRRIPSYPVLGNHGYETDDGGPFLEALHLPDNGGEEGLERWYSFDRGRIHFVAVDTERVNERQAQWLQRDLEAADADWIVAFIHKPPYSSGTHGSDKKVRETFQPIFEKYGVELVLAGHEHSYERTIPIGGTVYVVSGGGGASTRGVGSSDFTEYSEEVVHFVHGQIEDQKLVLRAIDGTGVIFDAISLASRRGVRDSLPRP